MGNLFGNIFKITTFGESHGPSIGVTIDGCPPLLPLCVEEVQDELNRRRPGQSNVTSPRNEADQVQIISGLYQGKTLGSPITMLVHNKDQRKEDYADIKDKFRPSHADYTYQQKYGIRDPNGGGRSSARETIGRVAAGVIAKKILAHANNLEIRAYVHSVGNISSPELSSFPSLQDVEKSTVRCPHPETSDKMIDAIQEAKASGDSLGGIIKCRIRNVPLGLGAPVFDRLEADLAKAMLSINASKGFDIGSGFHGTTMKGSEHNDIFQTIDDRVRTITNYSGGVQGGISNGEEIYFRVAFKPTSTILKPQDTVDSSLQNTSIQPKGRHDPCVLPRAIPIVEAMAALVLVDHWLLHSAHTQVFSF